MQIDPELFDLTSQIVYAVVAILKPFVEHVAFVRCIDIYLPKNTGILKESQFYFHQGCEQTWQILKQMGNIDQKDEASV